MGEVANAMTPFLEGGLRWVYGEDPPEACSSCGFSWSIAPADALDVIESSPRRFEAALAGRDGMTKPADGSWNATAYLWHLTDLARSWSERWVQIHESPGSLLVGWDPDELADVRNYRLMPTSSALWALKTAVATFVEVTRAVTLDTAFEHGDWGMGTVGDGLRWLGHEFFHHEVDVIARAE
jgi:hypothetical protein